MIKKLFFIILFTFLCVNVYAQDYWVYIRLEDRSGVTAEDDVGRSKVGDIVAILPDTKQYSPSELEKREYAIIKITGLTETVINEYISSWESGDTQLAYRRNKVDVSKFPLQKGIYPRVVSYNTIKNKIILKTQDDLARYEFKRKIYLATRPLSKTLENLEYAWSYWVRPAYASVACADDSTAGEQICTINKTGEDYNTITLWEDAKDGNLVTAQQIRTAECYDDDGALANSSEITIDGSTTSSDYYLNITVPSGERHGGQIDSGFYINHTGTSRVMSIRDPYTVLNFVGIKRNNASVNELVAIFDASDVRISDCVLWNTGTSDQGIMSNTIANNALIYNNILIGITTNAIECGDNGGSWEIYNNSVYGAGGIGIYFTDTTNTGVVKNNIAFATGNDYSLGDATESNNISGDATGSAGLQSKNATDNFVSISSGSEDLHLKAGADAIDAGTDLGTSANIDIDGRDRDAEGDTWDIGADEYVSAGTSYYSVIQAIF